MAVWYSRFELTVMVIIVQSCCLRQHKASFRSTHRPWRNNTADIKKGFKKEAQILVELNKTATHPPVMNHQRRTLLLTCRGICFYLGSASLGGVLMTALCSHEDSLHQIKKINMPSCVRLLNVRGMLLRIQIVRLTLEEAAAHV